MLCYRVKRGICSADSLINIALCCLGFLPGLLHAWYIIAITPEPTYVQLSDDAEHGNRGHVTYYFVQDQTRYAPQGAPQGKPQQGGYGTVNSAPNSQFPPTQDGFVQPPQAQAGPSSEETPPTYQQAVGDHKVQNP
jgi:hypothetical protein